MPTLSPTDIRLQQQAEITIGPYVEGEIPEALVVQFLNSAGQPVEDITGFDVRLVIKDRTLADGLGTTLVGSVNDGPNAKAQYVWAAGDLATPAEYVATMWVGNGTRRHASQLIEFTVLTSETAIPAI